MDLKKLLQSGVDSIMIDMRDFMDKYELSETDLEIKDFCVGCGKLKDKTEYCLDCERHDD